MNTEKAYVSVLSGFLGFFLVFSLIVAVNGFNLMTFVVSSKAVVEAMDYDELIDSTERKLLASSEFEELDDIDEFTEAVMSNKASEYYVESLLDAAIFGDDVYDSEKMYDLVEDSTEEFFDEHSDISASQREELLEGLIDIMDESVDGVAEIREDTPYGSVISDAKSELKKATFIAAGISVAFILIIILIHKHKSSALAKIGIRVIISQALSAVAVFAMRVFLPSFLENLSSSDTDMLGSYANNLLAGASIKSLMVIGFVCAVGIAMLIIGKVAGAFIKGDEDEDDVEYGDYQQPQYQYPVQQPPVYTPAPVPPTPPKSAPVPAPAPPPPIKRG